jgi:hypothetical protein
VSKVIAPAFENVSTDPESPTTATHNDWDLAISKPGEWQIDAQRGGMSVPMRLAAYYEPADVAAYVRQQLDWVDEPPALVEEEPEG